MLIDKDGKLIYRQVSRQRITQYQKSIEKKVIVAVYDVMFPPQDKAALEMAIDKANLSPKQRLLACQHHGLKGAPELDIPTIALRYEDIIGDRLPVGELPAALIKAARERLVQDELLVIKQKLVGASL